MDELNNLGCANGWYTLPDNIREEYDRILENCKNSNHKVIVTAIGHCYHQYHCPICGYTYTVDSSD